MVWWLFRRRKAVLPANVYDPKKNPYKARRLWPPDFSQMDQKDRFRLEKRWRRRSALAYMRPGWVKGVKIAQWSICGAVVVYALFFMRSPNPDEPEPFVEIRGWLSEQ